MPGSLSLTDSVVTRTFHWMVWIQSLHRVLFPKFKLKNSSDPNEMIAALKDRTGGSACFCPVITNHKYTRSYSPKTDVFFD